MEALREPCSLTIFGATGDLAVRKLFPALLGLERDGRLPDGFTVMAVGRRALSSEEFKRAIRDRMAAQQSEALQLEERQMNAQRADWEVFSRRLVYVGFDFANDPAGYHHLRERLDEQSCGEKDQMSSAPGLKTPASGPQPNRLYYLALPPALFAPVLGQLKASGLLEEAGAWRRVLIEKPFGTDLEDARALNRSLRAWLPEDRLYRIDHYLGKEMVQNILSIRFSNAIFEPIWNRGHVNHIEIRSAETIGVEHRGTYYETAGVLRDMVQNHILQMLALVCMEPPQDLRPESIRDAKVEVLRALRPFSPADAAQSLVLGQYGRPADSGRVESQVAEGASLPAYREEKGVAPDSRVPTFAAMQVAIDNDRWRDVPIYLQAGKRLDRPMAEIAIQFRNAPGIAEYERFRDAPPNRLVIKIQPAEGILFQINSKRPGNSDALEQVELDYCQTCRYGHNSPEAYQRLLLAAMQGDPTLFTRWDELEAAWAYTDSVREAAAGSREAAADASTEAALHIYPTGTAGPEAAQALLARIRRGQR